MRSYRNKQPRGVSIFSFSTDVIFTLRNLVIFRGVLAKLIAFAVALAVVPIGGYFFSLWFLFDGGYLHLISAALFIMLCTSGNTTYSAITAIVAANVVLVSYIIVSVIEDSSSDRTVQVGKQFESRKSR